MAILISHLRKAPSQNRAAEEFHRLPEGFAEDDLWRGLVRAVQRFTGASSGPLAILPNWAQPSFPGRGARIISPRP
ncbi:MAG: hypothetical protein ACRD1Y_10270 [Terriglobales bacterium]